MKKLKLLLIVTLLFTVYSCGPSVEGETKNWDRNLEQLKKMQTDYPAYADMIKTKISEAENVYDEATSISDEDKKADKMRDANNMLNQGCVGNLKNMNSKIEDIKDKKKELKNMLQGRPESDIKYAELIIDDSKDAVKKAEKVLNKKAEKLDANPCLKIESAFKELESVYNDLDGAIDKFNKIDSEEKNKEEEIDKDSESKDDEAKLVECEYCGKMNEAGSTECKYCGAGLK